MKPKEKAIQSAIEYMNKAIKRRVGVGAYVGACLYDKWGHFYVGFNIETCIHKGYHAEEVAIINFLLHEGNPKALKGIIIVYYFKDHEREIYTACASCRQFLWEFTNPDLLVTVVDTQGNIKMKKTLRELYPHPYPTEGVEFK